MIPEWISNGYGALMVLIGLVFKAIILHLRKITPLHNLSNRKMIPFRVRTFKCVAVGEFVFTTTRYAHPNRYEWTHPFRQFKCG